MPWDLDTVRAVAGYQPADTTHDAALMRVMDVVLATVENLLDRPLLRKRECVEFFNVNDRRLQLPRYPVCKVFAPQEGVIVHNRRGWIEPATGQCWRPDDMGRVVVDYEGGYDPLPSDLEDALLGAFSFRWDHSDPTTGLPVAGGGAATTGGEVSRVTINDFGSVSFASGGSSAAQASSTQGIDPGYWGWLAPWASILMKYQAFQSRIMFTY